MCAGAEGVGCGHYCCGVCAQVVKGWGRYCCGVCAQVLLEGAIERCLRCIFSSGITVSSRRPPRPFFWSIKPLVGGDMATGPCHSTPPRQCTTSTSRLQSMAEALITKVVITAYPLTPSPPHHHHLHHLHHFHHHPYHHHPLTPYPIPPPPRRRTFCGYPKPQQ